MIELIQLTKKYGDLAAVRNLNLRVPQGEIFGFIGPNGAGKTTTIKMLGGIISPTAGEVKVCGISMQHRPEAAKSRIGFIPDRPFLYEKLTGWEFLKFIADLYRVDETAFTRKAGQALETFGLSEWRHELIESYSHGMKQRIIMSAALIHDPEVIVVDEPMVGLDPAAIKLVKDLFKQLAAGGTTIFMSTHTLAVAEDICDRIGVIHRGTLIATGSPAELRRSGRVENANLEEVFIRLTIERSNTGAARPPTHPSKRSPGSTNARTD